MGCMPRESRHVSFGSRVSRASEAALLSAQGLFYCDNPRESLTGEEGGRLCALTSVSLMISATDLDVRTRVRQRMQQPPVSSSANRTATSATPSGPRASGPSCSSAVDVPAATAPRTNPTAGCSEHCALKPSASFFARCSV